MLTTEEERRAVEGVLKGYSFSGAWDMTNTGTAEHLFLVESAEFDSVDPVEVERELRQALPGKKVGLSPLSPTPHLARIY